MSFSIAKMLHTSGRCFMVLAALTMGSLQATVARAEVDWSANMETIQIGGVGNVRFMDPNHGYASGSGGTWAALSFEVTGMEPQPDGSILATMVHDFVTAVGGWVRTEDQVVMQPIPDSPGIFSLAVTYNVFETGDGMEGFEGQHFNSRGFIDTNRSIASVRYYGTISRKLPVH